MLARPAGTTAWRWPATRSARAPTCWTSAWTTWAATASPTWRSWPAASPPPPPCRSCSTPPKSRVIRAGLEKLGGRAVINSVNYEDGDGPESRFAKVTKLAQEHGAALIALTIDEEGQARSPEHKVAIAERLIEDLTTNWGIHESDILIDTLTFTICTGRGGVPRRRHRHHRGHPTAQEPSPGRPDDPGPVQHLLRPQPGRPRVLLNSVFLDECVKAGLDSAIVHASKILPIARLHGGGGADGPRPDPRPPRRGLRPPPEADGPLRGRHHQVPYGGPRRGTGCPSRWTSGSSAGSSTARRTAWRPTSPRPFRPAPPWTSSTRRSWTA
ncbi:dihydropteroate synthase [Streptomyces sp. L7]